MLKDYNKKDTITRDDLASDTDFIADATYFLRERNGEKGLMTNEEVIDKFMEHMRYQNVNEITALRDLEYAQNADRQGKQTFARLIDAYDRIDDLEEASDYGRMMLDYAQGIATAPSTYLGIVTGGWVKAAVAGTQAAKLGARKVLTSAIPPCAIRTRGCCSRGCYRYWSSIGAGTDPCRDRLARRYSWWTSSVDRWTVRSYWWCYRCCHWSATN